MLSWLALAFTTVGIALTVPDFGAGLTSEAWAGVLIAFLNAFLVAVYFIVNGQGCVVIGQCAVPVPGPLPERCWSCC
jgi:hypothetical protein